MELIQAGGWCAPSPEMATTRSFFADLAAMSDEELAAYAETQRGGGPCRECGGIGRDHQQCPCPNCEGDIDPGPCSDCGGSGIEPDRSYLYTREAVERFAKSGLEDLSLPEFHVRRSGTGYGFCACVGDPDCDYMGERP